MEYNVHFVRYRPFCGENGRTRGGLFYNDGKGTAPRAAGRPARAALYVYYTAKLRSCKEAEDK